MKDGKNLVKKIKEDIDTSVHKLTDKISDTSETVQSDLEDTGEKIEKKSKLLGALSKTHLTNIKKEIEDIKKALVKEDLIYLKTNDFAVVLRKLGGLDEFLGCINKLSKEGYTLVWTEPVTNLLPGRFNLAGSFYYLQKL